MIKDIVRFSFPTEISFGLGAIGQLSENIKEVGINKPLIVTDPGLTQTKVLQNVQNVLQNAGVAYGVFSDVHPNPLDEDISKALDVYCSEGCDGVIGLGGGSALDAGKVVRVMAVNDGRVNDYDCTTGGNLKIKGPLPPMIAIPTTAGTGSEVGRCSVITSVALGLKFMVCHPLMMPALALLDPELTVGLPDFLTAATGMDALAHCVESLTAPVFHPMCDAIAIKGIELVAQCLEKAVKTPTDLEARAYMQLAAMMGAVAFQKDLGAAHSLSHALSAVCHVQHGLANAIFLVPVMKFNREIASYEYSKVADCFGINTLGLSDLEAADKAIEAVADLIKNIGLPVTLSEVGVKESHLNELAKKAFLDPCHRTNPRPCTENDLFALYKEVL
jgi:alcohol dehydrogenase class IV